MLRELLENKHLYQNLEIIAPEVEEVDKVFNLLSTKHNLSSISSDKKNYVVNFVHSSFTKIEWTINNPIRRAARPPFDVPETNDDMRWVTLEFTPPTLKLFCGSCKRREAYNFVQGIDLLNSIDNKSPASSMNDNVNEQIFSFAYRCQACKGTPEIFIVRRKNLKLTQTGRTPMEVVETATYIPKSVGKYFSDAIIAFNSGQILAGNFLLRTFVEQYVRGKSPTPESQDIDALFENYSKSLPDDFKQRFPSLQSTYNQLSKDLHSATGSKNVFKSERENIEKHFQAKEIFDLKD